MLATGEAHSVREFVAMAFSEVGIDIVWQGEGVEEKGLDSRTGEIRVEIDPRYFRPTEVDLLIGDPSKAHRQLGWKRETNFTSLVKEMVRSDLAIVAKEYHRAEAAYASNADHPDHASSYRSRCLAHGSRGGG